MFGFHLQINGNVQTRDQIVSSELTMLVNASDNNAEIRCEATNSALEIPMRERVMLKVNCKLTEKKISSFSLERKW